MRIWFLLFVALVLAAADQVYTSAIVDGNRQLHIELASGKEILSPKSKGQVAFADASISFDDRTVGWLEMYPYPDHSGQPAHEPIAGPLVLYQAGRVLHRLGSGPPPIWRWESQDGGKHVVYMQAPMHGDWRHCTLADVASGRVISQWFNADGGEPPDWALCQ